MGLRGRLRKLEQNVPSGGTLRLPDGTEIRYCPEEMLEALYAAMDEREHRLLPYLRQIPTTEGMPELIRAIEGEEHGA